MSDPFLGEVKLMSFAFAPKGWALCNGQLLPINQNQALFSLLGTTYGGDGRVTFALPDLRGRVPIHVGAGHLQGERAGEPTHTLTMAELPSHQHQLTGTGAPATTGAPGPLTLPSTSLGAAAYTDAANLVAMSPTEMSQVGGSQPHENMQPYLNLSFCIALQGIFPSRN